MKRLLTLARSALALAILLALLLVPWFGVAAPLIARFERQDAQIAQTSELIARYRQIAAVGPPSGPSTAANDGAGLLLAGASAELTAADLQLRLGKMIAESGGRLRSVQVLPAQSADGLARVTLRVDLQTDVRGLIGILHAIETSRPLLFVDTLGITGPRLLRVPAGADAAAPSLPTVVDGSLQVVFEVSGYGWESGS